MGPLGGQEPAGAHKASDSTVGRRNGPRREDRPEPEARVRTVLEGEGNCNPSGRGCRVDEPMLPWLRGPTVNVTGEHRWPAFAPSPGQGRRSAKHRRSTERGECRSGKGTSVAQGSRVVGRQVYQPAYARVSVIRAGGRQSVPVCDLVPTWMMGRSNCTGTQDEASRRCFSGVAQRMGRDSAGKDETNSKGKCSTCREQS